MDELEELKSQLDKMYHEQNNLGIPDFEGYSPNEMQYILYDTFGSDSPVQLLELPEAGYKKIPLLNQIKYLLNIVNAVGELKLTARGFLPTKVVSDIYSQKFIKDKLIESGICKLYKETDAKSINLTRILLELSGLTKKRNGKLSLTKKGKTELNDNFKLLKSIINAFAGKFNWAYYDGYGDNDIGQLGFGFSLVLLSMYGSPKRHDTFYAKKYFAALPMLINKIGSPRFNTIEKEAYQCYSLRTFDRFLDYFGLIEIESENRYDTPKFIKKSELFDKLIKVRPHTVRH